MNTKKSDIEGLKSSLISFADLTKLLFILASIILFFVALGVFTQNKIAEGFIITIIGITLIILGEFIHTLFYWALHVIHNLQYIANINYCIYEKEQNNKKSIKKH